MYTKSIFISYARREQEFAERLREDLTSSGLSLWMDSEEITPGNSWLRNIHEALKKIGALIVVCSESAFKSNYVWAEWQYAYNHGKTVIPVVYDDYELPFLLETLHYVDFRPSYERGLEDLLHVFAPVPTPPAPVTDKQPVTQRQTRRFIILPPPIATQKGKSNDRLQHLDEEDVRVVETSSPLVTFTPMSLADIIAPQDIDEETLINDHLDEINQMLGEICNDLDMGIRTPEHDGAIPSGLGNLTLLERAEQIVDQAFEDTDQMSHSEWEKQRIRANKGRPIDSTSLPDPFLESKANNAALSHGCAWRFKRRNTIRQTRAHT